MKHRLSLLLVATGLAMTTLGAACATETADEDATASVDAMSVSNLSALLRGNVDRTKPDPYNPWAKTRLAIGEEYILPGEKEEFAQYAKLVNQLQLSNKKDASSKEVMRTFHAKAHACVQAKVSIDNSLLPASARVGLFANNATYPTWVRFSNGLGTPQADRKVDVRGLALKIMGVGGPRAVNAPSDESATTQDFLMADQNVAPASDARHMMRFAEAFMHATETNTIFGRVDSLAKAGAILTSDEYVRMVDFLLNRALPQTKKIGSPLGDTYFTGAASALGLEAGDPYTARAKGAFKLMVRAGVLNGDECVPRNVSPDLSPDYLRSELERRLAEGGACADIFLQVQSDPQRETIEDVSVEWQTPFSKVGRVTFGAIPVEQQRTWTATCDDFSFTPWHTLLEHRPLGNAMRARRVVLASSAAFRGASTQEPNPDSPR